jgi:hypothetical protein
LNRREYIGNLRGELESLGIAAKHLNEFNDPDELRDLTDNIKQTYYQDYKTACDGKD